MLFSAIRHLPALECLRLTNHDGPIRTLPGVGQFSKLQSATLTRIRSPLVEGAAGDSLQLAGLPALRELVLAVVHDFERPVILMADTFTAMGGLTHLALRSVPPHTLHIQLQPDSLRGLSALQRLELVGCGLTEIPAALAAVGQTLHSLDVSRNSGLQLTAAAHDMLLAMPQLRTLNVQKLSDDVQEAACSWTDRSVMFLMRLGVGHCARYRGRPPLDIVWTEAG